MPDPGEVAQLVDAPVCETGARRFDSDPPPLPADIAHCIATLEALREIDPDDPIRRAVERAAASLYKSAKVRRRRERRQRTAAVDRAAAEQSGRVADYRGIALAMPSATVGRSLRRGRNCYVCKQRFRELHAFYHTLCPSCAARNFAARTDRADLTGRRAIVTGGRIKIGFAIARSLLAAGAEVTITTRFPRDAELRYREAGLAGAPLTIVGVDFLDPRALTHWLEGERAADRPLDILINHAAQTVRLADEHHAALVTAEHAVTAALTRTAHDNLLDLRATNSWVLRAGDVSARELAEVHVVNAIVPYLIATRLRPLMVASRFADRYIVNVSAMEGVFAYPGKQATHPHTNMAKAALNMFTRTCASDFAGDGIYMNSVDTGWVSNDNPEPKKQRLEAAGFCPPLDAVDGAARVLAPIFRGVRGDPVAGLLFKDYVPIAW